MQEIIPIKIPKINPNFPPNQYDLQVISNGCGNHFIAETLELNIDGEFGPACTKHDWRYSEFCSMSKSDADTLFYRDMRVIIQRGNYNDLMEVLLKLESNIFYEAVDIFGNPSYSEYRADAIPPSLVLSKDLKMNEVQCISITVLISDNTYVFRWYTRQEAEFLGLI